MYPKHLKHKPILVADSYDNKDGQYAGQTDCKALSIGKAQWDNSEISAKIWRHSGKRWSRQSEEMPLHRCFDLCILALSAYLQDGSNYNKTNLEEEIIDNHAFADIRKYIEGNRHLMSRIGELKRVLDKYNSV
jgi:hypothetical protein